MDIHRDNQAAVLSDSLDLMSSDIMDDALSCYKYFASSQRLDLLQ